MMRIPFTNHHPGGDIRIDNCEGVVGLTLDPKDPTGPLVERSLTPDEAREVAAALMHHASEVERPR